MRRLTDMATPRPYWRHVQCDGCERACRYRDFHVFPGGGFGQVRADLFVASDDRAQWRNKRRGTVLGIMHAEKLTAWEHFTTNCQRNRLTAEEGMLRLSLVSENSITHPAHTEPPTGEKPMPETEKKTEKSPPKARTIKTFAPVTLPLDHVLVDRTFNSRQVYDDKYIDGLATDMKARGQLSPVLVMPNPGDSRHPYKLVYGFCRAEALKRINATHILCEIFDGDELAARAANIAEQYNRRALQPFEYADTLVDLQKRAKGLSGSELAKLVGISKGYTNNLLRCATKLIKPLRACWRGEEGAKSPGIETLIRWSAQEPDEQARLYHEFLHGKPKAEKDPKDPKDPEATPRPGLKQIEAAIAALNKKVADGKLKKEDAALAHSCLKWCAGGQLTIPGIYDPRDVPAPKPPKAPAEPKVETAKA